MSGQVGPLLKKWFTLQRAVVDTGLSPRALQVLTRLLHHHNNKTGECFPSEETLAAALGCTTRTVRNGLRELEGAGFVRTRKGRECPPRNYYKIKLYSGTSEDFRKAEKTCLHRRKKSSGKQENEPEKYRQQKRISSRRLREAIGMSNEPASSDASKRQELEKILAEKMGGGADGWQRVMNLDEAIVTQALEKGNKANMKLMTIADKLVADLDKAVEKAKGDE